MNLKQIKPCERNQTQRNMLSFHVYGMSITGTSTEKEIREGRGAMTLKA